MTRITILVPAALTAVIAIGTGAGIAGYADSVAFPSTNTHATPEMQAAFPDLFMG